MVDTAALLSICLSFATLSPMRADNSSSVGARPMEAWNSRRCFLSEFIMSCMCTGMRMVRDWSAIARVIDCRIHQVA
eukprot:scaffold37481_cov30-Tisochrysis_lutea.AAC.1